MRRDVQMHGAAISALVALAGLSGAHAHGGHHHASEVQNEVPVDTTLWVHIAIQASTWLVVFPLVMVLGLVRHRLHVPLGATALLLTLSGYVLGYAHKGRQFPSSAHGPMGSVLIVYLLAQFVLGVYLKLHRQIFGAHIHKFLLLIHGILGRLFPVLGWTQCLLGIVAFRGWCRGGKLGQCLAHYIMGSSISAYGIILIISLSSGGTAWLARRKKAQEHYEAWLIFLWGVFNTFTEHHGGPWTHKDLQHTMMGVLWWTGGAVALWQTRNGQRSVFPSLILLLTGWAMAAHSQSLMLSTMVHALFGYALCGASLARIVEICFVLKEQRNADEAVVVGATPSAPSDTTATDGQVAATRSPRAFSYLPAYLMVAAGILFMSATDEELHWADDQGVDGGTWGLIDFSWAFFVFFYTSVLVDKYTSWGGRYGQRNAATAARAPDAEDAYRPLAPNDPDNLEMLDRSAVDSVPLHGEQDARPLRGSPKSSPPRSSTEGESFAREQAQTRSARAVTVGSTNTRPTSRTPLGRQSSEARRLSTESDPHHVLWSTHEDPSHDPFADLDETATLR